MTPDELKVGMAVYRVRFHEGEEVTIEECKVTEVRDEMFRCSRGQLNYATYFEPSVEEALSAAIEQQQREADFHQARVRRAESTLRALVGDRKDHCA